MKIKKSLSVILLAAVITSMASCQGEPVTTDTETTNVEVTNEITETDTSNIVDDLPDEDFEGRAFRVLAGNLMKGTRRIYNAAGRYGGLFGSIRRSLKKNL